MKSSTIRSLVIITLLVSLGACRDREKPVDDATATIAPAQPQPAPTGTEAMTQTVDIEDSRSVSEGAALEETGTALTTTRSTATTTDTTTTPPPTTTTQ